MFNVDCMLDVYIYKLQIFFRGMDCHFQPGAMVHGAGNSSHEEIRSASGSAGRIQADTP